MIFSHFTLAAQPIVARDLAIVPAGAPKAILKNINLDVPEKCRAALVGANGTGKSTLLRTIAGLIPPAAGTIKTFGVPAKIGVPAVCYLAQRSEIRWEFPVTVRETVVGGRQIHQRFFSKPSRADFEKADWAIEQLALTPLGKRNIGELSGGQQQRVLLARALCQEARLLLLDEPYAGLDKHSRDIMDKILFGEIGHALTVVMATHALADALGNFDMILKISGTRLQTIQACRGHENLVEKN